MSELVLRNENSMDSIPADSADDDTSGFTKTYPDIPCVSQMLGGPSLRLGTPKERLSIPSRIGWGGNDTGRLVTWEFPLRIDSASWNSFESLIQFISFSNSCIRPESSKIVSWCSTNLRLAIVSKMDLWNFFNSSISLRLLMSIMYHLCKNNYRFDVVQIYCFRRI